MKKFLVYLVLLFLGSCVRDSPMFILKNESTKTFDSIQIYTSDRLKTVLKSVRPKDVRDGEIFFDSRNNNDGCYKLTLFKNGNIICNDCFGYYTNGASLNYKFVIIITNDSIIVK